MKTSIVEFCISLATVLAFTRLSLNFIAASFFFIALANASIAAAAPGTDTCVGLGATIGGTCAPLTNTTSGNNANTASGASALFSNTTGLENTASGVNALFGNTTGNSNTASGASALS